MIRNMRQEMLAERSMVVEPSGDGEYWSFIWYIDPISNGLSKSKMIHVHVYPDGKFSLHGMWLPIDVEEVRAMDEAVRFIRERFEKVGLDEESWN